MVTATLMGVLMDNIKNGKKKKSFIGFESHENLQKVKK